MPLAVCATPIGNLGDVTLRVLDELRAADIVLCEDTRHTRLLLARYEISARLLSLHAHNEHGRIAEILVRLAAGERVALVSDAGLPGISDPGSPLVRAAISAGVPVTVLPGPSAVETALVASGLAAERYAFVGFLPRRPGELTALWGELAVLAWPVVAFESPRRLPATLRSLAAFAPARELTVCRELTKKFEQIERGAAGELAERFGEPPKGEVTLVLAPLASGAGVGPDPAEATRAVAELVAAGAPRKAAADVVARLTGVPRNRLYRASL
jgi:16S rRNA (cytidine1402-2'-O)-methyltransferase